MALVIIPNKTLTRLHEKKIGRSQRSRKAPIPRNAAPTAAGYKLGSSPAGEMVEARRHPFVPAQLLRIFCGNISLYQLILIARLMQFLRNPCRDYASGGDQE